MAPPAPTADFDEGIFLVHLNKGKEFLGKGSLEQARQELERARILRPEEEKVLNLLGMLYFRMEKHPEARDVYTRLVKIHPDEAVLHSNLGIIEFKEKRFDEAEKHLQRALQLDPANTKPHQYLGLLYNTREDLDRAAEHFRKAGLSKMLDKVEQKRRQRVAAEQSGIGMARDGAEFRSQSPEAVRSTPVIPAAGETLPPAPDIDSIIAGLSSLEESGSTSAPRASAPSGRSKGAGPAAPPPLAEPSPGAGGPASAGGEEDSDLLGNLLSSIGGLEPPPLSPPPATSGGPRPVSPEAALGADLRIGAGSMAALDLGAALVPAVRLGTQGFGPFRRPGPGLIEMQVSGRAWIRRGSVTHYSGRLEFHRDRQSTLIQVQGRGSLYLGDDGQQTLLVELAGHSMTVTAAHLLAVGDGVRAEVSPLRLGSGEGEMRALRLVGQGCVAISVRGETLCLDVDPEQPTAADPRLVVAWSGELRAELIASEILREVMTAGARGLLSVRFEGSGTVLVEQPMAPEPAPRA